MSETSAVKTINWKKNLIITSISQFLAMIGFHICMPFIPELLKSCSDLRGIDDNVRGMCVSIFYLTGMLSLCIFTSVWGVLADRFGRKLMLLRASYGAAFLYPLLAFAGSFKMMLLVRFLSAIFSGTYNPAQTLVVSTTPPEKHGFALGVLSTAFWTGNVIGYLAGGVIADIFGYTVAFVTCGVIYLVSALLVQFFAEDNFVRPAKIASREKKKRNWRDLASPGVLYLMIMMLLLGIARRIEEPFIAMQVELVTGEGSRIAYLTGVVSAISSVGGIVSGFVVGYLCDRWKALTLGIPILILSTISVFVQALSVNILMLAIVRFFTYFAISGIQPVLQVMLSRITPDEMRGSYFGWATSFNTAGGIICSFISGALSYAFGIRSVIIAAAVIYFIMIPLFFPTNSACEKMARQ